MSRIQRVRVPLRAVTIGTLLLLSAACATRRREGIIPVAPVSAGVVWVIEEGDLLKVRVYRNEGYNGEPVVSANGTAFFAGLGRVAVGGLTIDSLEALLNARYGTLVREPAVQVSVQREITMYGQIRAPGVYAADPATTLLALVARAGGQSGSGGGSPEVTLEKADGRRFLLPREARLGSLDIHRQDAVYFADQSFFLRNATAIQASSVVVTTLSALLGLILTVSR